jgi:hypothetical protein
MFDNNFVSWDFYILNYLISFKDIRYKINNLNIDEVKPKTNRIHKDPPLYYSEEDKCFSFIMTLTDRKNILYKIQPSKLYVNVPNLNQDKWYEFNLKQMKILNTFSNEIKGLETYFKKVLFLNKKQQISLDMDQVEKTTPILFKCLLNSKEETKINWITSFM